MWRKGLRSLRKTPPSKSRWRQNFEMTTNAYRMGVDFRVLPKTTISYDQFLEYNKYDTIDSLANTPFLVQSSQFPGTLPVNLGINWYYPPTGTAAGTTGVGGTGAFSASAVPCATPFPATGYVNNATGATQSPQAVSHRQLELQDGPVVYAGFPLAEFHAHGAAELSVHIYPKAGDVRFGQLQQQPQ